MQIALGLFACIAAWFVLRAALPRLYLLWKLRSYLRVSSPINFEYGRVVLSLPKITLEGGIHTRLVSLEHGRSNQLAFDWWDDHADVMWQHTIFNRYGQFFIEQETENYGRCAGLSEGVYIGRHVLTMRKLRKNEVRKLNDGDFVVQLRNYLHRDRDQHHVELVKCEAVQAQVVPLAAA